MKPIAILFFLLVSMSAYAQGEVKKPIKSLKKNITYFNENHQKIKNVKEAVFFQEEYILSKESRLVKEYNLDSILLMQGNFAGPIKKSYKQGAFKYYFSNGQLKYCGLYTYGSKQGEWLTYNEDGTLLRRSEYEKGLRVDSKYFLSEIDTTQTKEPVFNFADQNPIYVGGEQEMTKFIGRNFNYPDEAREMGQQGTVYCEFIVGVDGAISAIKIVKGVSDSIDDEVMRVIKAMPKWEPGVTNDKVVRTRYTVPIRCRLG